MEFDYPSHGKDLLACNSLVKSLSKILPGRRAALTVEPSSEKFSSMSQKKELALKVMGINHSQCITQMKTLFYTPVLDSTAKCL